MEEIVIFDRDEIFSKNYMIRAINNVKVENEMQEKKLKTYIDSREKALKLLKNKIDDELRILRNYRPILEDR